MLLGALQAFRFWKVEILVNALSAMKAPHRELRSHGSLAQSC